MSKKAPARAEEELRGSAAAELEKQIKRLEELAPVLEELEENELAGRVRGVATKLMHRKELLDARD